MSRTKTSLSPQDCPCAVPHKARQYFGRFHGVFKEVSKQGGNVVWGDKIILLIPHLHLESYAPLVTELFIPGQHHIKHWVFAIAYPVLKCRQLFDFRNIVHHRIRALLLGKSLDGGQVPPEVVDKHPLIIIFSLQHFKIDSLSLLLLLHHLQ